MMHIDRFITQSRCIVRRNILALLFALSGSLASAASADGCAAGRLMADAGEAPRPACDPSRRAAYPFAELLEDPAASRPALALAAVLLGGMALRARPR